MRHNRKHQDQIGNADPDPGISGYRATEWKTVGAPGRIRTSDRLVRSQVLYPTELLARHENRLKKVARSRGFEPLTAWFVARYSIQLSYERA